jgi:hypothetical protein
MNCVFFTEDLQRAGNKPYDRHAVRCGRGPHHNRTRVFAPLWIPGVLIYRWAQRQARYLREKPAPEAQPVGEALA